jgi:subtilisin family serine protease
MATREMLVVVAAFLVANCTEVFAQNPPPSGPGADVDAASKRFNIESMLQKFGRARVIVEYKNVRSPAFPSLEFPAAHERFALSIGAPTAALAKPIGTSQLVSARVNAAELKKLKGDENVIAIIPDIPIPPALFKSLPLIGIPVPPADGPAPNGGPYAVAVLDTGIDENHPFLKQAILKEHAACFSTNDASYKAESLCPQKVEQVSGEHSANNCNATLEICTHGTHVAGIIAGWAGKTTVDGTPVSFSGVAPEVRIVPIQIYSMIKDQQVCEFFANSTSPCVLSFISSQAAALEHVARLATKIRIAAVNVSLSYGSYSANCDKEDIARQMLPLIQNLRNLGIATITATGNEGYSSAIGFPACISSTISVAAGDKQNHLASTWPAGSGGSNFSDGVHFVAPGVEVVSAVVNSAYRAYSGTSVAAPHVTAVIAKTKALFPLLTVDKLEEALRKNATSNVSQNGVNKPIIHFSETELKIAAAPPFAAPASAPGIPAGTALPPLPESLSMPPYNRFIVDYGIQATAYRKTQVRKLLTRQGVDLGDIESKSSKVDVISTNKPLDPKAFDPLKRNGAIKDVFRDLPISGIQMR